MDGGEPMPQMTRAEQETETEASRLSSQIERAMTAVALRSESDREELEAVADALERTSRNLVAALRELADERKRRQNESDE